MKRKESIIAERHRQAMPPQRSLLLRTLILLSLGLLFGNVRAFAASATWNVSPGSGDWNTGANWSLGVPNGVNDAATFGFSNTTAVSLSASTQVNSIVFTSTASAYTITVSSTGSLLISGTGIANTSGTTQSFVTSGSGNITFTGTATAGNLIQFTSNGGSSTGALGGFVLFSATSNAGSAILTSGSGTNGGLGGATYFTGAATGGTGVQVITNGNGIFDISGLLDGGLTVGSLAGSGTDYLGDNTLTVGANNVSTNVSGVISDGGMYGNTGGSLVKTGTGTLTLAGANTYTGNTTVSAGTLAITGTINAPSASFTVDGNSANVPLATLANGALLASHNTSIGLSGTGAFTQSGGVNNIGNSLNLAVNAQSSGTYTLGGGSLQDPSLNIGISGSGTFIQTGGTNTVNGLLELGQNVGSYGVYTSGSGSTLITGGIAGASGTSVFNFNGGTLMSNGSNSTLMGGLTKANVQTGGEVINTNGFSVTISQSLLHSTISGTDGGLTITGSGSLTLSGVNTYNGPTFVKNGTLILPTNSSFSLGSGTLTIGAAGSPASLLITGTVPGQSTTIGTGNNSYPAVVLAANSTISLVDGVFDQLIISGTSPTSAAALTLSGSDTIDFDVDSANSLSDFISLSGRKISLTGTNTIVPNFTSVLTGTSGVSSGAVYLIENASNIATTSGTFILGSVAGSPKYVMADSLTPNGTNELLTFQYNPFPLTAYFTGSFGGNWNAINGAGLSGNVNFNSLSTGGTNTGQVPFMNTDVHFYATSSTGSTVATTLGQNFTINSLTLDGTSLGPNGTHAVSIAGNILTIQANGTNAITVNPGAGALTISSSLVLGGTMPTQTFVNNSSNLMTISGTAGGTVTGAVGILFIGTGSTTISAPILTTGPSGLTMSDTGAMTLSGNDNFAGGLTMSGAGVLTLSGNDTYTGSTTVSSGTLAITGTVNTPTGTLTVDGLSNPLPTASLSNNGFVSMAYVNLGLSGTGTFILNSGTLATAAVTGANGTSIFDFNGGTLMANSSINATVFMNALTAINVQAGGAGVNTNGYALTITQPLLTGVTSGSDGGLTVTGSGSLTLPGVNTYNGPTKVKAGTLVLQSGGSLAGTIVTVGSGTSAATLQISGGSYTIGTSGVGGLVLSASTGTLSMVDGTIDTLSINSATSGLGLVLGGSDTIDIEVSGGTADSIVLQTGLTASITGTNTINPVYLIAASGTNKIISSPSGGLSTGGTFILGAPNINFVGTTSLDNLGNQLFLLTGLNKAPGQVYFSGTYNNTWNTVIGSGTGGKVNFTSDVTGTNNADQIPLVNTNVHFYATNLISGTVATTLGQNFNINSLTLDGTSLGPGGANSVSIAGNTLILMGTGGSGITVKPGAGSLTISSAVVIGGTQTQTWTNNSSNLLALTGPQLTGSLGLTISGTGNTLISAPISVTGASGLIMAGSGVLTLSGTSSYTGVTTVNSGTVVMSGPVTLTGAQTFINNSASPFNINGGTVTTGNAITVSGSTNTAITAPIVSSAFGPALTMSGTGMLTLAGNDSFLGDTYVSSGTLAITSTVSEPGSNFYIDSTGSTVPVTNLSGSLSSYYMYVGNSGTGSFIQTGGTNTLANEIDLGESPGSAGTYNMSGGSLQVSSIMMVGVDGTGGFIQTGGTNANPEIDLAEEAGSVGSYTLNGGSIQCPYIIVGAGGAGTFIQTGGTNSIGSTSGGLLLASGAFSSGTYTLSGGLLNTWVVSAGFDTTSVFNFNGGILQSSTSNTTFMSGLTTANVLAGGAIVDTNGFAITIPQPLLYGLSSGTDGGLTKVGLGTLTLSATNNYNGPTTVIAGTLIVSGSLTATGSVSISSSSALEVDGLLNHAATSTVSGTLTGSGAVGAITVLGSGKLAPGFNSTLASSGTLAASGNVLFTNSTSIFSIRLGVATAADSDQLLVTSGSSTVSLNGATLQLTLGGFYAQQTIGSKYVLINGQAAGTQITGQFAQGTGTFTVQTTQFHLLYGVTSNGFPSGNDVLLVVGPAVPEPGTWAMFAAAAAIAGGWRRTRRRD